MNMRKPSPKKPQKGRLLKLQGVIASLSLVCGSLGPLPASAAQSNVLDVLNQGSPKLSQAQVQAVLQGALAANCPQTDDFGSIKDLAFDSGKVLDVSTSYPTLSSIQLLLDAAALSSVAGLCSLPDSSPKAQELPACLTHTCEKLGCDASKLKPVALRAMQSALQPPYGVADINTQVNRLNSKLEDLRVIACQRQLNPAQISRAQSIAMEYQNECFEWVSKPAVQYGLMAGSSLGRPVGFCRNVEFVQNLKEGPNDCNSFFGPNRRAELSPHGFLGPNMVQAGMEVARKSALKKLDFWGGYKARLKELQAKYAANRQALDVELTRDLHKELGSQILGLSPVVGYLLQKRGDVELAKTFVKKVLPLAEVGKHFEDLYREGAVFSGAMALGLMGGVGASALAPAIAGVAGVTLATGELAAGAATGVGTALAQAGAEQALYGSKVAGTLGELRAASQVVGTQALTGVVVEDMRKYTRALEDSKQGRDLGIGLSVLGPALVVAKNLGGTAIKGAPPALQQALDTLRLREVAQSACFACA
jgi:hypothetical protein